MIAYTHYTGQTETSEVHRDSAFVLTLAAALNLSTEQLDSLFTQAAQL